MISFWLRSAVDGVSRLESSCELMYMTISTASTQPVALTVRSGMKRKSCEAEDRSVDLLARHLLDRLRRHGGRAADVAPQVALQEVEEADEERHLREQRQARGERIDLVLRVELHDLLLLALLVVLVLAPAAP